VIACAFAIPGDLGLPTGGYRYDREVLARLPAHGVAASFLPLPGSFPFPPEDDLAETRERLGLLGRDTVALIDGLAFGAFDAATLAALPARTVALVHHPLAHETGLSPETADTLRASERAALARARAVVATSRPTADLLAAEYGVPADRLTVAEPGVEPAPRAGGSGEPEPAILAVGAISARKGYGVLVNALAAIADAPWRMTIVGATDRNPDEARRLEALIAARGLSRRIALAGAVSEAELDRAYEGADLFVVPSLFEGYGMVVTEAIARGLPIVSTTGGALASVVPDDAALKVPPGDAGALAGALGIMLGDPRLRRAKAEAAWAMAGALPRWDDTAASVAAVIREVGA
jgi:glycosyltransferase involved in cell wall biosynthesis